MTNKEQIENLDPPTICDNCIHDEVCGIEGHLEPAMTYCGWKEEKRPQGEWIDTGHMEEYWEEEYQCSICGEKDHWHNFCPHCGAKMMKEAENDRS